MKILTYSRYSENQRDTSYHTFLIFCYYSTNQTLVKEMSLLNGVLACCTCWACSRAALVWRARVLHVFGVFACFTCWRA